MRSLRAFARLVSLAVSTAGMYTVWLAGRPVAAALSRSAAWRTASFSRWARWATFIVGMRVEVRGTAPSEPGLLVANHLGYVDIVLLAGHVRCAFVAKAEVARWPVIGFLARSIGTIFVDRTRPRSLAAAGRLVAERLARGESVLLFPEGTSTPGVEVGPFGSSLLQPATEAGLPVRWATLRYATPAGERPARDVVSWWGEATLVPHLIELLGLPSFRATLGFGSEPRFGTDRKALALELQHAVSAAFVPMPGASGDSPTGNERACLPSTS